MRIQKYAPTEENPKCADNSATLLIAFQPFKKNQYFVKTNQPTDWLGILQVGVALASRDHRIPWEEELGDGCEQTEILGSTMLEAMWGGFMVKEQSFYARYLLTIVHFIPMGGGITIQRLQKSCEASFISNKETPIQYFWHLHYLIFTSFTTTIQIH